MNIKYKLASLFTIPFECKDESIDLSTDMLFSAWRKMPYNSFSQFLENADMNGNIKMMFLEDCKSTLAINIYELEEDSAGKLLFGNEEMANKLKRLIAYQKFSFANKWNDNSFWGRAHLITIPKKRLLFFVVPVYCEFDYNFELFEVCSDFSWICSIIGNRSKIGLVDCSLKKTLIPFTLLYSNDLQSDEPNYINNIFRVYGKRLACNRSLSHDTDVIYKPENDECEGYFTKSGAVFVTSDEKVNLCKELDKKYWDYLVVIIEKILLDSMSDKLTSDNAGGDMSNKKLLEYNKDLAYIRATFMLSTDSQSYLYESFCKSVNIDNLFNVITERLKLIEGIKSQKSRLNLQIIQGSITWFMLLFAVIPTVNDAINLASKSTLTMVLVLICEFVVSVLASFGLNRLTFMKGER